MAAFDGRDASAATTPGRYGPPAVHDLPAVAGRYSACAAAAPRRYDVGTFAAAAPQTYDLPAAT